MISYNPLITFIFLATTLLGRCCESSYYGWESEAQVGYGPCPRLGPLKKDGDDFVPVKGGQSCPLRSPSLWPMLFLLRHLTSQSSGLKWQRKSYTRPLEWAFSPWALISGKKVRNIALCLFHCRRKGELLWEQEPGLHTRSAQWGGVWC